MSDEWGSNKHAKTLREILGVWLEILRRPDLAPIHELARKEALLYKAMWECETAPRCKHCGHLGKTHDACASAWEEWRYLAKSEADAVRYLRQKAQPSLWTRGAS
jgi:hypothetical protein